MKKLLILALVLMMVLSLAACDLAGGGNGTAAPSDGSDNTPSGNQEQSTASGDASTNKTGSYDLTTIEGYLGQFGLTEDFLKLPTFTRFGTSFSIATKEISDIYVYQSEQMSTEQKQAYVKAVTDVISAISDDKTISNIPYGKAYTLDVDYSKTGTLSFAGMITVNGKKAAFVLSINNTLDGNADMAYPAAIISIEYR